MSTRTVLVSVGLLACCGIVSSQPQQLPPGGIGPPLNFYPPPAPTPQPPPAGKSLDDLVTELERLKALMAANRGAEPSQPLPQPVPFPGGVPLVPAPPAPPPAFQKPGPNVLPPASNPEKTVDDLLTELERVKALKADLEKRELELKAAIRKKLEQQTERLQKLGVAPKDAKEPDRIGRIIIEGNTKTPDKKILGKLDFRPGQVLQYPSLEVARAKLVKAGFHDATVEVIPSELDPTFKDIRVRVSEQP